MSIPQEVKLERHPQFLDDDGRDILENLATTETDTTLVPHPDGVGGVEWGTDAGGSAAITVQDEGSPLTTAASTLNFVGSGVIASGAGATKTVTIPGASGTGASVLVPLLVDNPNIVTTTGEAVYVPLTTVDGIPILITVTV